MSDHHDLDLDSCDLHHETMRGLMAGVRTAADRMKGRLPAHVDVNDVVSAGYLALTQALAYWQDGSEEPFEIHAMKRASAAMVSALRTTNPPPSTGQRFVNEMSRMQQSVFDALGTEIANNASELPEIDERASAGSWDTLVSPPCNSEHRESHFDVEPKQTLVDVRSEPDVAAEEIGVHVA